MSISASRLARASDEISAFIQSARIDAEGLRLAVDLDRGDDSPRDGAATGHALPVLPELRIRDAEVSIRIDQFHLGLKKIRLETGMPSPEGRPVHLQVSEGSWTPLCLASSTRVGRRMEPSR